MTFVCLEMVPMFRRCHFYNIYRFFFGIRSSFNGRQKN